MDVTAVERWAEAYRVAWQTRDAEAAATLFSEDATYRDNIYEEPHRGRAGVTSYWSGVTASQSDVSVRMGKPFVDGGRAVVEFWTTMRIEDAPMTLGGALLLHFNEDGMCTSLREYYSFTEDRHEPPAEWGT